MPPKQVRFEDKSGKESSHKRQDYVQIVSLLQGFYLTCLIEHFTIILGPEHPSIHQPYVCS